MIKYNVTLRTNTGLTIQPVSIEDLDHPVQNNMAAIRAATVVAEKLDLKVLEPVRVERV
jgi:hypothetical protein